jgi:hypothetical protein
MENVSNHDVRGLSLRPAEVGRARGGPDVIRIAISVEAYEAIAKTLLRGSARGYENEVNERGERVVWFNRTVADRLGAMRGPGESYSDVILRIAGRDGAH